MDVKFVNPYNFIPFGEGSTKVSYDDYYKRSELKSGWIDVSMYVKTPLIIPDGAHQEYYDVNTNKKINNPTEKQKKASHKKYDFYHITENGKKKYMIPGSELRGMIRSMYEAMTDSCLPHILHDKPMSQRVPTYAALTRRGLLEYNKDKGIWKLWATNADRQKCKIKYNSEEKISRIFDLNNIECFCGTYISGKGYLQCNVPVTNKEEYKIAYLNKTGDNPVYEWKCNDNSPYDKLKSALKRDGVKGNQSNPNELQRESLLSCLEQVKNEGGMVPVRFFIVERNNEKMVYLSNSSIGRIAQHRKWEDILSGHTPCKSIDELCPACLLFGTINGGGARGKVRFSDGECLNKNVKTEPYLLDILGEPRTSSFEFYLRKPTSDATYWNFDFYGHKIKVVKENKDGKKDVKTYNEFRDLSKATPRGRKAYWHGKPVSGQKVTKLNSTMEGINAGNRFSFKIHFDQISDTQLENLLWIITLGENNEDSNMWHKLGHARPLGYGSVKLCVDKLCVRNLEYKNEQLSATLNEIDKESISENLKCNFDKKSNIFKSIVAMCNSETVKNKSIMYPRYVVTNNKGSNDNIFNWFAANRVMGKNAKGFEILPEPYATNITLRGSIVDDNPKPEEVDRRDEISETASTDIIEGTIDNVNDDRGFGFINYDNGNSIFFHHSQFSEGKISSLKKGTKVTFKIGQGKKGKEAKNVKTVNV